MEFSPELRKAVSTMLASFQSIYPSLVLKDQTVIMWCKVLEDLPPELIVEASMHTLYESEYPTLPPVKHVRDYVLKKIGKRINSSDAYRLARQRYEANGDGRGTPRYTYGELDKQVEEALFLAVKKFGFYVFETATSVRDQIRFQELYEEAREEIEIRNTTSNSQQPALNK